MCKNRYSAIISIVFAVSGCATSRTEKPILTLAATNRIASECGAVRGVFHRSKPLPYVTFYFLIKEPGKVMKNYLIALGRKLLAIAIPSCNFDQKTAFGKMK